MEKERQLAAKARAGDVSAFAGLYKTVYADLYHFALYLLKNREDAKDAVSDTVIAAFEEIHNLRREELFKSWIFKILFNKCRRKMREYVRKEEWTEQVSDAAGRARGIEQSEAAVIRTLFYSLSEEERSVIGLHLFAGYTSREIGQMMGLNENTVRSKERRALKKLAEMMSC